jgi:hypothetical protein
MLHLRIKPIPIYTYTHIPIYTYTHTYPQVKRAYEHSIDTTGQGGKVVTRLLNTAVSAGKRVRTETGISKVRGWV